MNAEWITRRFTVTDTRMRASLRPIAAAPKLAEIDGSTWLCGTDGHIAAAVPFDGDGERAPTERYPQILARPTAGAAHSVAALREWAGAAEWPTAVECDECGGDGYVVTEAAKRYGMLLGVPINKSLLARLVEGMPDEGVVIVEPDVMRLTVRFAAPDDSWRAAMVGMIDPGGTASLDVFQGRALEVLP